MAGLQEILSAYVLWIIAAHVIAVIAWMAGMLYLPRLFVYHTETAPGSEAYERFTRMEARLLRRIVNPAMIVVWILGLTLAWITGAYLQHWFHAKFVLVIILSGIHGLDARWWKAFRDGRNTHSARYFRIVNEIPAVLMILIVILVVVKPF
jgi:putative membrane protein